MSVRRLVAGAGALALTTVGLLIGAGPAHADAYVVPFKDANVNGQLGFCDKNDKPITSGNIRDVPFAVKTVSTVAAPKAWQVKGRKAVLYGFSAVKNQPPGQWIADQMSPASLYSNTAVPMAAMTYADSPLEYHTTGNPPLWDGLVQLRMYFTAPNTQMHIQPYPAAVIRVTGDTWTLVQGDATPNCGAGKSITIDQALGVKKIPTAPPTWAANSPQNSAKPTSGSSTPASGTSGSGSSAAGDPSSTDGASGSDGDQASASSGSSSTSIVPIALAILGGTALGAVAVGFVMSRRTRSDH